MTPDLDARDPRIGGVDPDTWRAAPHPDNPDGDRIGCWLILAGDMEDEPDVWIEVIAEHPGDVAEFVAAAVRNEYARLTAAKPRPLEEYQ